MQHKIGGKMAADITKITLAFDRGDGSRDEIVHVVIPNDNDQDKASVYASITWAERLGEVLKNDLIRYVTDIARVA